MVQAGDRELIRAEELLIDPLHDRKCKTWHMPAKRLSLERLFEGVGGKRRTTPNTDLIRAYQMAEGMLSKEALLSVLLQAKEVLAREANLLRIEGRTVMFGDIHGQFYDMCDVMNQ